MRVVAILNAALLISCTAWAEEPTTVEVDEIRKDVADLRKKIKEEAEKKEFESLRRDAPELRKEIAGLRQALDEALKMAVEAKAAFKVGQVLNVIKVTTSKEDADAFIKASADGAIPSEKVKGFRGLAVAENITQPGSFLVISLWDDEESLKAYVSSKPQQVRLRFICGFGDDREKSGQIKSANFEPPGRFVVKEN